MVAARAAAHRGRDERVRDHRRVEPAEGQEPISGSRRALLGKGALAAAVAATAGLAVSRNASAANGDPLEVGATTSGTATTGLDGGSTLVVTDGSTAGATAGSTPPDASIIGRQTVDGAVGVVGSNSGAGGGACGARTPAPTAAPA